MHRLTSAFLLGGAVVLTSYITAPAAPTTEPARVSPAEMAAIDAMVPLADDLTQETERLRARLAVVPELPVARRDPFSFGPVPRPTRRAATTALPEPVSPTVDSPPAIAWPTLVALLTGNGTPAVTTAVLAIGDVVEMLKAGETAAGLLVREVTTTSVELVHVATSTITRLSIR